jgi:hypothetical protein
MDGMIATTESAELLALEIGAIIHKHVRAEQDRNFIDRLYVIGIQDAADEIALRLAAKPAEDVQEATIKECAKIALDRGFIARTTIRSAKGRIERFQAIAAEETAQQIYKAICALSTTGQQKS